MKRILLILLLPIWLAAGASGQSFSRLWKQVEEACRDDLPRTALGHTESIRRKALAEGNDGELLRAMLTEHLLWDNISTDSAASVAGRMEAALAAEKHPAVRALWHSALGQLYAGSFAGDTARTRLAARHLLASLAEPEVLAAARATDYLPLFVKGADSRRYFADDLLSVLVRTAADGLGRLPRAKNDWAAMVPSIYNRTARFYQERGLRPAALLARIAALDATYRTPNAAAVERHYADLLSLADEYADLPENVETYIALTQLPSVPAIGDVELLTHARKAIARYGREKRASVLRNYVAAQEQPRLNATFPAMPLHPGTTIDVVLRSRAVGQARLALRPLRISASDPLLLEKMDKIARRAGKAVCSAELKYDARPAYRWDDDTLRLTLPAAGIYLCELTADGRTMDRHVVNVSAVRPVSLVMPDGRTRVALVDGQSGAMLTDGRLVLMADEDGKRTQRAVVDPDADGFLWLDRDLTRGATAIYPEAGDDRFSPAFDSHTRYGRRPAADALPYLRLNLYTDRAIYRPGQTVRFGAVAYTGRGDSLSVLAGRDLLFRLHDASGRAVATLAGRTDAFGTAGGEFRLPEVCLPGHFSVRVDTNGLSSVCSFRVEEYKRPTFTLTPDEPDGAYALGDTVRLTGRATTYTGLPLAGATLRYRVVRHVLYGGSGPYEAAGSVATDSAGRYAFFVPLTPDSAAVRLRPGSNRFIFTATLDATAENGETVSATQVLTATTRPYSLSVVWPETVCREQLPQTVVHFYNAAYRELGGDGTYTVRHEGRPVTSGTFTAGRAFRPSALATLPSGAYTVTFSMDGYAADSVALTERFVLFSEHDTALPVDTAWFCHVRPNASGDSCLVLVGSSRRGATLFYDLTTAQGSVESRRLRLDGNLLRFDLAWRPEWGDGARLNLALLSDGRLHTQTADISKPLPDKRLVLRWTTFRSRLTPGQDEEWRLHIEHPDGTPARASLMARLYDASLDAFGTNPWNLYLYFPRRLPRQFWMEPWRPSFSLSGAVPLRGEDVRALTFTRWDDRLFGRYGFGRKFFAMAGGTKGLLLRSNAALAEATVTDEAAMDVAADKVMAKAAPTEIGAGGEETEVRSNFSETAFFHPSLRTDAQGNVSIAFTLPESLTSWAFEVLAHDLELNYGRIDTTVTARKDFMVQAAMPRFVRRGDHTELPATLRNLTDGRLRGTLVCTLTDAATGRVVARLSERFDLLPHGASTFYFPLTADGAADVLVCRFTAESGRFADGEEHLLPVLSDRVSVVRTLPFSLIDEGSRTLRIDTLWTDSRETADRRLTIETATNPTWYAVSALPSLSETPGDDAITLATRYYAVVMADAVAHFNPEIGALAARWSDGSKECSTWARLMQDNPDLKQVLLAETPWMTEAATEAERARSLARLFDGATMAARRLTALDRLCALQRPDGSWAWFRGMNGNPGVTTDVAVLLARLEAVGSDSEARTLLDRALTWLDSHVAAQVERMKAEEQRRGIELDISHDQLQYLYIRGLRGAKTEGAAANAVRYLLAKAGRTPAGEALDDKALRASVLSLYARYEQARTALRSLVEHSVATPDMGRYFDSRRAPLTREAYKIPTQTAVIEALLRADPTERTTVDELRLWLMQQKRTQMWTTPRATADAVYALLVTSPFDSRVMSLGGGSSPLTWQLTKGRTTLAEGSTASTPDAPAGYARADYADERTLDATTLTVNKQERGLSWGSVYVRYTLPASDAATYGNGLRVERTFHVWRDGAWQPLAEGSNVRRGERVRTQLDVTADRDFDFVCLRSARPACLAPVRPLSGYTSLAAGLWGYRAVRDASTEYFFERLPKGRYTVTDEHLADRSGSYSCGTAVLQSVYAPEFSAQTAGFRLTCEP